MLSQIIFRVIIIFISSMLIQIDGAVDTEPLILTPFINKGSTKEAKVLASVDPTAFLNIESYTGFITVNPKYDSNLFFWYFPHADLTAPLVIFLGGGPGISSMIGLFHLIGPVDVERNLTLKRRTITWSEEYSLLFIDQPVGSGFSFTNNNKGYATNEDDVGSQLYIFLQQFLEVFPELIKVPLFITGESYAGKYVPAFAYYVHLNRERGIPINLKGIALGNPLIDLKYMFRNYNKLMRELSFMNGKQLAALQAIEEEGLRFLEEGMMIDASNKFNETIEYIKKKTGVNIYNFLKSPKNITAIAEWFVTKPDIRKLIHVGNTNFNLNNQLVYEYMRADISNSSKPFIEKLLENYGVMIYSGQLDLIVPHSLTNRVIDHFQWSRRSKFDEAPRRKIFRGTNSAVVGYRQSGGHLTEVVIRNSGHMVPLQQPDVLKFLLNVFVDHFRYK